MLRSWKSILALPVVLSVITAAACSGGGSEDDTAREITNEELAQMVLTLEQFGPEFGGFIPEATNGLAALDQLANDDDDPAAERADLEQFSFAGAFRTLYENPQATDGQATTIGSSVLLFGTADGAADYLQDIEDEMRADQSDDDPAAIWDWSELEVADETVSLRVDGPLEAGDGSTVRSFQGTIILFRHGRIIAGLVLYGFSLPDPEKQRLHGNVEALAPLMNDRIAAVLAAGAATVAPAAAGP